MSRNQRLVLLAAAVAVVVGAIVIGGGGDDDDEGTSASTSTATETQPQTPTATAPSAPEPPAPTTVSIEVRNSKPVGGVQEIDVKKGERIRFTVTSDDTSDEVHFHGYDISKDLAPGSPVRFDVPATVEGVFEVELEGAKEQVAEVRVEPS